MGDSIALLTGSMNPFTKGHKYVVDTGLLIFDHVFVGIGINPNKTDDVTLFSREQRIWMCRESLVEHGDRVSVDFFSGASVDYASKVNATAMIRGLRDETDQAYEASISHANALMSELEHGRLIPTIYIPCPPSLTEISSSRARELIELRRSLEVLQNYLLPAVVEMIEREIYSH
ncbi:MAG: pantetheine-phosphate adenylyltransferase [Limisphaerales bacterium]